MPLDGAPPKEEVFDFSDPNLFNPIYIPTFQWRDPVLHYFGSAGSGKSVFVAQKKIIRSFLPWRKGRKTLVARRYYNSLGQSCFSQLKAIIYSWGLEDCFKFGTSPYYIRNLKTGVEFVFLGLDDVEKIKSIHGADDGWIEEATEMRSMSDLNLLRDRLRGYKFVQWDLTYNPTDAEHFINKEIHIPKLAGHRILKSTYLDNHKLLEIDPGYADRLEAYKETNPNHWRVYAKGEWGKALEGLVYPNYSEVGEMPCVPQAYGLDFGWNDATAMCKVALVDEIGKDRKQLYVEEVCYLSKHTPEMLIKILDAAKISKKIPIVYDTAQPGPVYADALRSAGYWLVEAWKGPGSVLAGINNVKGYDLRPVAGGKSLFAELNGHSWKQKNGIWLDEPQDGLDHLLDGMRYGCWYLTKPVSSGSVEFTT